MRFRNCLIWIGVLATSWLLPSGCKKAEVRIYDVAKDTSATTSSSRASGNKSTSGDSLAWTAPTQWEALPPTQFRKGNYRYDAEEAGVVEIAISSFPGTTGGLLANVNRWLGQAGLPPVDQVQLEELVEQREISAGIECTVVDLKPAGEDPSAMRIYAATLMFSGESWFFKMSGPSAAVDSQIDAFDQMIATLDFGSAPQPAELEDTPSSPPDSNIVFTVPEGWTESEGSPIRIASLKIEKDGLPPADFSITAFPGDTGGTVANVNRWRRQIGLEPWSESEVLIRAEHFQTPKGYHFDVFDLKSEGDGERSVGDERILAAILVHEGKSWFFKLRGDTLLLETQRNKFDSLLFSVDFAPTKE